MAGRLASLPRRLGIGAKRSRDRRLRVEELSGYPHAPFRGRLRAEVQEQAVGTTCARRGDDELRMRGRLERDTLDVDAVELQDPT
jgi:hypothetical protein